MLLAAGKDSINKQDVWQKETKLKKQVQRLRHITSHDRTSDKLERSFHSFGSQIEGLIPRSWNLRKRVAPQKICNFPEKRYQKAGTAVPSDRDGK